MKIAGPNIIESMRKFWRLVADSRITRYLVFSLLTGLLLFLVESSFIYVLQGFLSSIGLLSDEALNLPSWYPRTLVWSALALVLFGSLRAFATTLKDFFSTASSEAFVRFYSREILRTALFAPELSGSQELIHIYNAAMRGCANLVQQSSQLVITIVSGTLLFVLGFWLAPYEMLISLALLAVLLSPLGFLSSRVQFFGKRLNVESRKVTDILMMGIKNHFLLRIYSRLGLEFLLGDEALGHFQYHVNRYLLTVSFKRAYPIFAGTVIISFVTYVGMKNLHSSAVSLLAFFYVFMRFSQTMSEAMGTTSLIRYSADSIDRVATWYEKVRFVSQENTQKFLKDTKLNESVVSELRVDPIELQISDLEFEFESGRNLFGGLSLSLKIGDVLVLHGPSGVGKSTLIQLIAGLVRPKTGSVRLNQHDCGEIRPELVQILGYVGPENYLNQGSVRENLQYCLPGTSLPSDDDIWSAVEQAQFRQVVEGLPGELEEELHETVQLSSGQKQRLAIARALLRRPRILIMDEATANLDEPTEQLVLDALRPSFASRITIFISHRDSLDSVATQILTLSTNGKSIVARKNSR